MGITVPLKSLFRDTLLLFNLFFLKLFTFFFPKWGKKLNKLWIILRVSSRSSFHFMPIMVCPTLAQ